MALHRFTAAATAALLGLSLAVAAPGMTGTAEAGAKKKVEIGLKFGAKTFKNLEKAGRSAQKKRGIVGKAGGILKNVGKGGSRATTKAGKAVNGVSKGATRAANKSGVGRTVTNGLRDARRIQNGAVDKAFRSCRGKACDFGRDGLKLLAPF